MDMKLSGEKAQNTLQQSMSKFEYLTSPQNEAIVIHNGQILDVNQRLCELLGFNYNELVGLDINELTYPKDVGIFIDDFSCQEVLSYEARAMRKDGMIIDIEITPQYGVYRNEVVRILSIRDITKLKKEKKKQRELQEIMNTVFSNSSDILIQTDIWGIILNFSRQHIDEFDKDKIIGNSIFDFCNKINHHIMSSMMNKSLMQRKKVRYNLTYYLTEKQVNYAITITPIVVENEIVQLLHILHDNSEVLALHNLHKNIGEKNLMNVANGVAHDINNYLNTISMITEYLKIKPETDELQKNLGVITELVKEASLLTRQLQSISDTKETDIGVYDLNTIVSQYEEILNSCIRNHITFNISFSSKEINVVVDKSQLLQLFTNLLINANDSIGSENGMVNLELNYKQLESIDSFIIQNDDSFVPGEYATIYITDTGCGIPEELLDKIFEPHFSTKISDEANGIAVSRGMGLTTVLGIVKFHNGQINVYSTSEGTRIEIYLPMI
ncbi:MAG: PAS domain S-box protein [Candidatus Heimdallarchaeota archaeon]|nr:PAS domain S-box protein [Candidatus Heimdallarchaeota archaeon]